MFESMIYAVVFLWTSVLLPADPSLGIVFYCFMCCISIGNSLFDIVTIRIYHLQLL